MDIEQKIRIYIVSIIARYACKQGKRNNKIRVKQMYYLQKKYE